MERSPQHTLFRCFETAKPVCMETQHKPNVKCFLNDRPREKAYPKLEKRPSLKKSEPRERVCATRNAKSEKRYVCILSRMRPKYYRGPTLISTKESTPLRRTASLCAFQFASQLVYKISQDQL